MCFETERQVQRNAGQRGDELETGESRVRSGGGAFLVEAASQATSCRARCHEERSNAGGPLNGIEEWIFAVLRLIAAIQACATAPAPRGCKPLIVLHKEVRPVRDQLRIDTKHIPQSALRLSIGVEAATQLADRRGDELLERRDILGRRSTNAHGLKYSSMNTIANVLIGIVALLHVYFLVLEMFLWDKPTGRRVFNLTPEFAAQSKALAANQGLYNGFLAAGLIWGVALGTNGMAVKTFFLLCVIVAGVFGAVTANRRILWIQAFPGALALLLLRLS